MDGSLILILDQPVWSGSINVFYTRPNPTTHPPGGRERPASPGREGQKDHTHPCMFLCFTTYVRIKPQLPLSIGSKRCSTGRNDLLQMAIE